MDQLQKLFKSLSIGQRVAIAAVVVGLIAGLTSFVRWHHESDFRPLFTSMAPEDAAAIVQKLKESGVEHRLTDNGGSVLVPSSKVDELRIELAGAGLPRTGRIGFELFDKTNLGVTDFAEHVNYRRALEGELERSIRALNGVEQARVHLTFPKDSVFLDAREPAKASVLVSLRAGARLTEQNVSAVTNLIASAVEGLNPESVSVVDMRGNLLSRPKKNSADSSDGTDAALAYKHDLEKDLLTKVESTLTPLLGEDHFRAGISADCDFSTSEQTDETYDPTRSVMTNSQKAEDLSNRPDSNGVPGTGSNLPRPISRPAVTGSSVSRRTENIAYETSRSVRQVKTPRGALKRISASIVIDQDYRWEGKGAQKKRVPIAPSPEKVKAIHDLVAGIIGLTPARGDQLIIESLAFEQNRETDIDTAPGTPQPSSNAVNPRELLKQPKVLIGAGAGVLILVALGAFLVVRRKKSKVAAEIASTPQLVAGEAAARTSIAGDKELAAADKAQLAAAMEGDTAQLSDGSPQFENIRDAVRANVARDPILAAGVIRSWVSAQAEG